MAASHRSRALVLGYGYVGRPLCALLHAAGWQVDAATRNPTDADRATAALSAVRLLAANVTDLGSFPHPQQPYHAVLNVISSKGGGESIFRSVYLDGTRHILHWIDTCSPGARYVHTSSTSVYGQNDGRLVDESSLTQPASATSRILVEVENLISHWASHHPPGAAICARSAGIYGPDRGHLFQQFLRGEARIHGDGSRWLNMIHLDDLTHALLLLATHPEAVGTYNIADDEPVTELDFFTWLATRLQRPLPVRVDASALEGRRRGVTSKRVSNRRLRQHLGFALRYPTYREGYENEIQRLRLQ